MRVFMHAAADMHEHIDGISINIMHIIYTPCVIVQQG